MLVDVRCRIFANFYQAAGPSFFYNIKLVNFCFLVDQVAQLKSRPDEVA